LDYYSRIMKSKPESLSEFVKGLQRSGRYSFTRAEASQSLGSQPDALTKALQRLVRANRICQVQRGFYATIPIEYESSGAPPTDWFIDKLMQHIRQPYYAGVLTAAALHGAAHQQPQEYQVVVPVSHPPIRAKGLRIRFFRYSHMKRTKVEKRPAYTGTIPVSTPEYTALDVVRFSRSIGGLDAALTVLGELGEKIRATALLCAAKTEPVRGNVQRLGWLLDRAGHSERTGDMASWLACQHPSRAVLNSSLEDRTGSVCPKWYVIENDQPEDES